MFAVNRLFAKLANLTTNATRASAILKSSTFFAPLTHSLALTRGSGSVTFTRATTATVFDNENKLITVPSGCSRHVGARYVRNLFSSTATLASGSSATVSGLSAGTYTFSMGAGTGTATFSGTGGATGTLAASASGRVEVTKTITAGTFVVTASVATLVDIQLENVTGQADQTASEYVSVGVLSAPYHGLAVDGIKAFDTNKNGSPISRTSLEGYLSEPAATNNILYCRDLTQATAWTASNITPVKTATGIDNAANSATTLTAAADNGTILQPRTLASAARSSSAHIKRRTGSGSVYFTRDGGTTWTDITSSLSSSAWYRAKIENSSVTNPSVGFKLATSGDAIDVDYVQDEANVVATSPILTTTATVTRNADVLTYSNAVNTAVGTAYCAASTSVDQSLGTVNILTTDANGRILYMAAATSRDRVTMYDGVTASPSGTGLSLLVTTRKRASKWGGSSMVSVADGVIGTPATFDGSMGATTTLNVGHVSGSGQLNGKTKSVHIWDTSLTDEQLKVITR